MRCAEQSATPLFLSNRTSELEYEIDPYLRQVVLHKVCSFRDAMGLEGWEAELLRVERTKTKHLLRLLEQKLNEGWHLLLPVVALDGNRVQIEYRTLKQIDEYEIGFLTDYGTAVLPLVRRAEAETEVEVEGEVERYWEQNAGLRYSLTLVRVVLFVDGMQTLYARSVFAGDMLVYRDFLA